MGIAHPHRAAVWRRAGVFACSAVLAACSAEPTGPRKTHLARLPASVGTIAISDDAKSHAYVDKSPDRMRVVHDRIPGATYPGFGAVTFSPSTHKLFYWAGAHEGPGYLIADGQQIGDFGREGTMVFSVDGKRWATATGMREDGRLREAGAGSSCC
jgi:hypothetical protein